MQHRQGYHDARKKTFGHTDPFTKGGLVKMGHVLVLVRSLQQFGCIQCIA